MGLYKEVAPWRAIGVLVYATACKKRRDSIHLLAGELHGNVHMYRPRMRSDGVQNPAECAATKKWDTRGNGIMLAYLRWREWKVDELPSRVKMRCSSLRRHESIRSLGKNCFGKSDWTLGSDVGGYHRYFLIGTWVILNGHDQMVHQQQ
jgi:hypothetical protein